MSFGFFEFFCHIPLKYFSVIKIFLFTPLIKSISCSRMISPAKRRIQFECNQCSRLLFLGKRFTPQHYKTMGINGHGKHRTESSLIQSPGPFPGMLELPGIFNQGAPEVRHPKPGQMTAPWQGFFFLLSEDLPVLRHGSFPEVSLASECSQGRQK